MLNLESVNQDFAPGPLNAAARDLILECRELLRGERSQLTAREDYVRARLSYWRARADGSAPSSEELAA
jgi:hypothetical protein